MAVRWPLLSFRGRSNGVVRAAHRRDLDIGAAVGAVVGDVVSNVVRAAHRRGRNIGAAVGAVVGAVVCAAHRVSRTYRDLAVGADGIVSVHGGADGLRAAP